MNIMIVGGTGLIGTALVHALHTQHKVWIVTRKPTSHSPHARFISLDDLVTFAEPIDAIINLAGTPLNAKRWSASFRNNIYQSRVNTTRAVVSFINRHHTPVLINASAIGIYNSSDAILTEDSTYTTQGFTQTLCHEWERTAFQANESGCRVSTLRLGVVLAPTAVIIKQMKPLFSKGLGAILGQGDQWFSWIHLEDAVRAILWILTTPSASGAFNLTAPMPVTHRTFCQALAKTLRRPLFLQIPVPMCRLLFGEISDAILLTSHRVLPQRLLDSHFAFKFANVEGALRDFL